MGAKENFLVLGGFGLKMAAKVTLKVKVMSRSLGEGGSIFGGFIAV